jgi:protocatechuate 3,4-dioxygenase beta subunit
MFGRQTILRAFAMILIPAGVVLAQGEKNGGNVVAPATQGGAVHMQFSLNNETNNQPVTVTIAGKVTDAKTGEPISQALVRGFICGGDFTPEVFMKSPYQQSRSDANGLYKLSFTTRLTVSGPGKGQDMASVSVNAPNYETRAEWLHPYITPRKTDFADVNFALGPGKLLKGKAVDEDGKPIEGARVTVQDNQSAAWMYFGSQGETTTDAEGNFTLWCSTDPGIISQDRARLEVTKTGYGSEYVTYVLKAGSVGTVTVPRGGTIAGRVVDAAGKGVAGVEVIVMQYNEDVGKATTDEAGRYEVTGVPGKNMLTRFYKAMDSGGKPQTALEVYARPEPSVNLRDVPQYKISAKDGQTVTGPNLAIGLSTGVSGKVIPSGTTFGLKGLLVRLDYDWGKMVEVDADGNFRFPIVSPGKHRLAVYLPTNLRYDPGIGRTEIKVEPGQSLVGVEIKLDPLAEVRVQILDPAGTPLEGITAGATWSKTGDGPWTEGTRSDKDGNAVVYVYPEQAQYVRGFDMDGKLVSEGVEKVEAKPAQVIEGIRLVMVPPAQLTGRLIAPEGSTLQKKRLLASLKYADGNEQKQPLKLDAAGRFRIERLVPGVVGLTVESVPAEFAGGTAQAIEIQPGQAADLGDIALTKVKMYTITGRLVPSPTFDNLKGFKVRLDLMQWEPMVETDAEGRFVIPNVPAGKHRITAYLPYNLRTDRGVGHAEVVVKDKDFADAKLPLETLATIRMKIVDESGKPLEGISAAAWWSADHSGVFTEGAKSDPKGIAMLYVYPGELQYVGAHDWDKRYTLKADRQFTLKAGQAVPTLTVVMTPASGEDHDE